MPECDGCYKEADDLIECLRCNAGFCEACIDMTNELCFECQDPVSNEFVSDDEIATPDEIICPCCNKPIDEYEDNECVDCQAVVCDMCFEGSICDTCDAKQREENDEEAS